MTSIDLKYYDRHAETPKYRMPYKDWEKSDQNSWGSYILVGKVDVFGIRFEILAWVRYGVSNI